MQTYTITNIIKNINKQLLQSIDIIKCVIKQNQYYLQSTKSKDIQETSIKTEQTNKIETIIECNQEEIEKEQEKIRRCEIEIDNIDKSMKEITEIYKIITNLKNEYINEIEQTRKILQEKERAIYDKYEAKINQLTFEFNYKLKEIEKETNTITNSFWFSEKLKTVN